MMKKLMESVQDLVELEYDEAMKNYPLFNSAHEGASVIREEIEEAEEALENLKANYDILWDCTKRDSKGFSGTKMIMKNNAKWLACEAIQVAAMCLKFTRSEEKW